MKREVFWFVRRKVLVWNLERGYGFGFSRARESNKYFGARSRYDEEDFKLARGV